MKQCTTKKIEHMKELRELGYTHQMIADEYGCSRQYVHNVLARYNPNKFRAYRPEECIYTGLRRWLNENRINRSELHRILNISTFGNSRYTIKKKLIGETYFRTKDVDLLIEASGLTYEQLFREAV